MTTLNTFFSRSFHYLYSQEKQIVTGCSTTKGECNCILFLWTFVLGNVGTNPIDKPLYENTNMSLYNVWQIKGPKNNFIDDNWKTKFSLKNVAVYL